MSNPSFLMYNSSFLMSKPVGLLPRPHTGMRSAALFLTSTHRSNQPQNSRRTAAKWRKSTENRTAHGVKLRALPQRVFHTLFVARLAISAHSHHVQYTIHHFQYKIPHSTCWSRTEASLCHAPSPPRPSGSFLL